VIGQSAVQVTDLYRQLLFPYPWHSSWRCQL